MYKLKIDDDNSNKIVEDNLTNLIEYINNGDLRQDIMETALDHFKSSFPTTVSDRGGYMTDSSSNGWEIRKKDYTHPTLNKTGHLLNSIRIDGEYIVSDTDYGVYHNEGTDRLPQRQFIGDSEELNYKITDLIQSKIESILQ